MKIANDLIIEICKFIPTFADLFRFANSSKQLHEIISTHDSNLFLCLYLRDFGIDFWNFCTGAVGASFFTPSKRALYNKLRREADSDFEANDEEEFDDEADDNDNDDEDDIEEDGPFRFSYNQPPIANALLLKHDYSTFSKLALLQMAAKEHQRDVRKVFKYYDSWHYCDSNYDPFVTLWKQKEGEFLELASQENVNWFKKCEQVHKELHLWTSAIKVPENKSGANSEENNAKADVDSQACSHILVAAMDEALALRFFTTYFSQCYTLLQHCGQTFKFKLALKNGKPNTIFHVCKHPVAWYENYRGVIVDAIIMLISATGELKQVYLDELAEYGQAEDDDEEESGYFSSEMYKWYHTCIGQAVSASLKGVTLVINDESPPTVPMKKLWQFLRLHGMFVTLWLSLIHI